jgi:hypothetical protein
MGSWWQNQLALAEGFIEKVSDSVDKRVQSAVGPNDKEGQEASPTSFGHALPRRHATSKGWRFNFYDEMRNACYQVQHDKRRSKDLYWTKHLLARAHELSTEF